jgi:hypothetical protein
MSKGSGNAKVRGRASKLDSRFGEIVWVDDRPEGLRQCKGDDDGNAGVSTGSGAAGKLCAAEESAAQYAVAHSSEQVGG